MRPVRLTALLGLALAAACQPAPPPVSATPTRRQSIPTARVFVRHALANDFAALARDYYTDDAIVLPPNAPAVTGPPRSRRCSRPSPRSPPSSSGPRRWRAPPTLAYVRGRYTMTMSPPGPRPSPTGKYLEIWRKQSDGS